MSRRILLALVVLAIGVACVPFVQVTQERVLTVGTDTFESHHALYGPRHKSQTVTLEGRLTEVGAVLVNLRRAANTPPATVSLRAVDDTLLAETNISPTQFTDDSFAWVAVPRLPKGHAQVVIDFSASSATTDTAVGLRFDQEHPERSLALAVRERVPLHHFVMTWASVHPNSAERLVFVLIAGVILTLTLLRLDIFSRRQPRGALLLGALGLVALTLWLRLPLAQEIESAYGGDAFNYLLKSRAWLEGEDPFAADPRKAPFFSLLLLPGFLPSNDPVWWGRFVSSLAASGMVVGVLVCLVRLGLPLSAAMAAALLTCVNRHVWWESVHGLANTTYAALWVALAYALTWIRSARGRAWLAAVAGLLTITRYEGGTVVPIVLGVIGRAASWRITRTARAVLPLLVLLAIPFLLWPLNGQLGIRTWSDVTADGGLSVAFSYDDWINNTKALREFWAQHWLLFPQLGQPKVALISGVLAGVLGAVLTRWLPMGRALMYPLPYVGGGILLLAVTQNSADVLVLVINLLSFLIGCGAVVALRRWPAWGVPIVLMLVIQTVTITAILPKTRYYLPLIPFGAMALVIAGTTVWLRPLRWRSGVALVYSLLIALVFTDTRLALSGLRSDYNEKSHDQTVTLAAARYLREVPGRVAVVERSELPLLVYLGSERVVVVPEAYATAAAQAEFLQSHPVDFLLETSAQPFFGEALEELAVNETTHVREFTTPSAATVARLYTMAIVTQPQTQ